MSDEAQQVKQRRPQTVVEQRLPESRRVIYPAQVFIPKIGSKFHQDPLCCINNTRNAGHKGCERCGLCWDVDS